jgi:hypothetical protein
MEFAMDQAQLDAQAAPNICLIAVLGCVMSAHI